MWKFLKKFLKKEQFGYGWLGNEKEYLDERNYHTEEIFKSYPSPNWVEKNHLNGEGSSLSEISLPLEVV